MFCPFAGKRVVGDLCATSANPNSYLVRLARDYPGGRELFAVGGGFHANRGDQRAVFHLFHFGLTLIDPMQLNLIEAEVSRCGRYMIVGFRGEIKVPVARHHDMQLIPHGRDGKFVGRLKGRLRGGQRPGTNAGILLGQDRERQQRG